MKVTVCFGEMKVIVPCSDGDLTVLELIGRAVSRFKKASQEARAMDITVHCLKTCEELAILDIDDLVSDVCDDKDKLIAVYEERPKHDAHSSDQRSSNVSDVAENSQFISVVSDDDSGVTADAWNGNPGSAGNSFNVSSNIPRGIQRKLPHAKNNSFRSSASSNSPTSSPEVFRRAQGNALSPFSRDLGRKSLSINHPMLYSWIDQQDRMRTESLSDPLKNEDMVDLDDAMSVKSSESAEIELDKESASAVTIKPYSTADGREMGLVVHDIETGSKIDVAGSLQTADQITEINGVSLRGRTNAEAKSLFEAAINSDRVKLKRTRSHNFSKSHSIDTTPVIPSPPPRHISSPAKQLLKRIPDTNTKESKEIGIEAPEAASENAIVDNKMTFNINIVKGKDGLGFSVSSKDVLINNSRDFFVKTVLNKGAAVEDGRIKAGDRLLEINGESISDKSQQDVVKILRNASGTIRLLLSRERKNDGTDIDVKSDEIVEKVKENVRKYSTSRPVSEIDRQSTPKPPLLETDKPEISRPRILPERNNFPAPLHMPDRQDFSRPISGESLSPLPDEIFTLSIPLSIERTSGLGISVKGKRREGAEQEDRGIYIKSVIKGGAAERDGRLQANDQLLCISGTSLIGISNNEAMNILRESMQGAVHDGQINLIIGRPAASPNFGSPLIGSTAMQRGRPISMVGIGSEGVDEIEQRFEDMYLKKHHMSPLSHKVVRNQSYFRALDPPIVTGFNEQIDKNITSNPQTSVSIGSSWNPKFSKSQSSDENRASRDILLPTYEEALQRNTSLSRSSSSSTNSQKNLRGSGRRYQGDMQFESLPDKMTAKDMSMRDSDKRRSSLDASQSSLDTLLMGPSHMPFSRDAFGRLSMSEKKGRAQLDANKSNLYNKLKKYKSMEELRVSISGNDDNLASNDNLNEPIKRTESLDTLISKVDEEEKLQDNVIFNRGTLYASSTPWYSPSNDRKKKRGRNQPMNDSLQEALEKTGRGQSSSFTKGNDSMNGDKKKKGFLKGIGDLLKGKKKTKDEYRNNRGRSLSPRRSSDAIKRHEAQLRSSSHNLRKARSSSRPLSMSEDMLNSLNSKDDREFEQKYNKVDQIQKELVNAQIAEKERRKKEQRKKEKMTAKVKVVDSPEPKYNIYSTWDAHTPENFREKSRQMYSKKDPNDSSKGLQRQSSLPPRAKKNSSENFRRDMPISASVPVTSRLSSNSSTSSDSRQKTIVKLESNSGLKTSSPLPRVKHYSRTPAKEEKPFIRDSSSSQSQSESSISTRAPVPKTQSIADLTSNTIISISHTANI